MILMVPPISFIQTYPVVEAARVWDRASFPDPHYALKQKLAHGRTSARWISRDPPHPLLAMSSDRAA
jgi:hypothetical protein